MIHDALAASLHAAVAAELLHVREGLEQLAEMFVADEHFAENYLEQLQAFDLLIQHTDESAAILDRLGAGACPREAAAPVRLEAIHGRLHAALAKTA